MAGIVTLLTDFGSRDAYVGIMKGVILCVDPTIQTIDLTHEVAPQGVLHGALALRSAAPYFPSNTVHLAVVDPGVGTARSPIVVKTAHGTLVGPDNGLLAPAAEALGLQAIHCIDAARWADQPGSSTFHGRDLFAPCAAALATGTPPEELGEKVDTLVPLPIASPAIRDGSIRGEVIYIDRFGNLITNISETELGSATTFKAVRVGCHEAGPLQATYGSVATGRLVALISSWGHLEIAVRDGNAAATVGARVGDSVVAEVA